VTALLSYDPTTCSCCACPTPTLLHEYAHTGALIYGYTAFGESGPTAGRYRTAIAYGWGNGTFGASPAQIVENYMRCTYRPLGADWSGNALSRVWGPGWEDPPPPSGALIGSSAACDDGYFSFFDPLWSDISYTSTSVTASDAGPRPRGAERLLGAVTLTTVQNEVIAAARAKLAAGPWTTGGDAESYYEDQYDGADQVGLAIRNLRYRFRFSVPTSGQGIRFTWSLRWTPRTRVAGAWVDGTPTDQAQHWRWDKTVPPGYDADDIFTWPLSPWFYVPQPTSNGIFSIESIESICGRTFAPAAPGAGSAIAV
jgi:hypothetical protein